MRRELSSHVETRSKSWAPIFIALGYLVIGVLWILFSDRLLARLVPSMEAFARWETYKGWGYVIVTAGLLYSVLRLYTTRWQEVEEALRESETRFRRAVVESPYPTILHAEGGDILLVNKVWSQITGYAGRDLPTITAWTEKAYGDAQAQVRADIDRLYDLDRRIDNGEYVIATSSGEQRTWQFSSAPLGTLPDGRRLIISIAIDITERKQAEQALREHREHLEAEVAERTADLRTLVDAMAGREIRMAELKDVIRQLRQQLKDAGLAPAADDPLFENHDRIGRQEEGT